MKSEEKLQQVAYVCANNSDPNGELTGLNSTNDYIYNSFLIGAKSIESLEYWKEKEKLWTNEEIEILLGKAFDKAATYAGFSTYYCASPEKYAKEWFNQYKKK